MADSFQLKAILSAVDKISPVLKQVAEQAKNTKKYLGDVVGAASKLSGKIGLPLGALSALTAGFSAHAIKEAVVGYTEMSEELIKMSLRSGIATDQLQQFKYVAEQGGVDAEAFAGAMGKLNLNIGNAAAGKNKNLAALFKRLHIDMRDANGQVRSGIDLLPQLADAFAANKNPVTVARMGMAAFGKKWQDIIPMLAEGSEDITKSLDRFKRYRSILPESSLREAKELGDKLTDLKYLTRGFSNMIAAQLVPVIQPLVENLIKWASANKKLIQSKIKEYVKGLAEWIKTIDWHGIAKGAQDVVKAIGWFVDMVGGARNALIGLVVFVNLQTIVAFYELAAAGARAAMFLGGPLLRAVLWLGRAFLLNPWGLAITALVVGAYLIYKNWDKIKKWFGEFFEWIGKKWDATIGWIRDAIQATKEFLGIASFDSGGGGQFNGHGASGSWGESKPLLGAPGSRVSGSISVNFENAPAGMRVGDSLTTPGFTLDPTVGYRSAATGG